jgi:hypothetical protein
MVFILWHFESCLCVIARGSEIGKSSVLAKTTWKRESIVDVTCRFRPAFQKDNDSSSSHDNITTSPKFAVGTKWTPIKMFNQILIFMEHSLIVHILTGIRLPIVQWNI